MYDEQDHSDDASPTVDELIASGAEKTSRKYRRVARLPEGMTGLQALEKYDPEIFKRYTEGLEAQAKYHYLQNLAHKHGDQFELSRKKFNEFMTKTTGKEQWEPKGDPCSECQSLGHQHAKNCPNRKRHHA